ncbi:MAG: peptidoglycan editing factor PgeF [Desulfobacterales bacterium]|nr:peptidoglycan editing factor PgeF [Desulfobacterales bacterium]
MHVYRNGLIQYLQFEAFQHFPELTHAVFTRTGGVSDPPFDSFNMSYTVGDMNHHVAKNRSVIQDVLGQGKLIHVKQVHGSTIALITDTHEIEANDEKPISIADAMITAIPGLFLLIQVADCQSVMLYDPVTKMIANIHSGWRGSLQNIIGKTVHEMQTHFQVNPMNIVAGICPSLGPCCAEFVHYEQEIPKSFWMYKDQGNHFNFWALSHEQLIKAGVLSEHIHLSQLCTKCHSDLFYSYRKQNITGRFGCVIGITS